MTKETYLRLVFFITLLVVGGGFVAWAFLSPKAAPWIAAGYLLNYAVCLYRKNFPSCGV